MLGHDGKSTFKLTKFQKTNKETCYNQKPIVKKGEKVKAGDVVIYDATEFVYDGSVWQLIGNTSAETTALNALDGRVGGLEQRMTGLEGMTASTTTLISTVSDHETRLDQAELDIDGVQAQLTWGTFTSL